MVFFWERHRVFSTLARTTRACARCEEGVGKCTRVDVIKAIRQQEEHHAVTLGHSGDDSSTSSTALRSAHAELDPTTKTLA